MNKLYEEQVSLLLRILPLIYREEDFAVHGGTAINLFIKNLPRYPVDVDLTYIPLAPREESLACNQKKADHNQSATPAGSAGGKYTPGTQ